MRLAHENVVYLKEYFQEINKVRVGDDCLLSAHLRCCAMMAVLVCPEASHFMELVVTAIRGLPWVRPPCSWRPDSGSLPSSSSRSLCCIFPTIPLSTEQHGSRK